MLNSCLFELHTPIEAVFLVDPDWGNFRAIAKRSAFVNWKDGSAILWDRSFVKPWTERLKIFGLDITQPGLTEEKGRKKLNSLYEKLTDESLKQLQSRFPINYWVVPLTLLGLKARGFLAQPVGLLGDVTINE